MKVFKEVAGEEKTYTVQDHRDYWTVHVAPGKEPYIMNRDLRLIKGDGKLGKKILAEISRSEKA